MARRVTVFATLGMGIAIPRRLHLVLHPNNRTLYPVQLPDPGRGTDYSQTIMPISKGCVSNG
jgi:hypothetical protein